MIISGLYCKVRGHVLMVSAALPSALLKITAMMVVMFFFP